MAMSMKTQLKRWKRPPWSDSFKRKKDGVILPMGEVFAFSNKPPKVVDDAYLDNVVKKRTQPNPVRKIKCVKCGELLLKIYPWADVAITRGDTMLCKKCANKR